MTKDEEKGYLFYIFKISKKGYSYEPVDPKYYSEESLKNFAKQFAKDGILYKTEKECQDVVAILNAGLHAKFDFSNAEGVPRVIQSEALTVEDGFILVSFPSGRTLKLRVDPVYEEIYIDKVED